MIINKLYSILFLVLFTNLIKGMEEPGGSKFESAEVEQAKVRSADDEYVILRMKKSYYKKIMSLKNMCLRVVMCNKINTPENMFEKEMEQIREDLEILESIEVNNFIKLHIEYICQLLESDIADLGIKIRALKEATQTKKATFGLVESSGFFEFIFANLNQKQEINLTDSNIGIDSNRVIVCLANHGCINCLKLVYAVQPDCFFKIIENNDNFNIMQPNDAENLKLAKGRCLEFILFSNCNSLPIINFYIHVANENACYDFLSNQAVLYVMTKMYSKKSFKRLAELLQYLGEINVNLPLKFDESYKEDMNDFSGKNPLTFAALNGYCKSFKLLVKELHADIFAQNDDGKTTLDYLLEYDGQNFKPIMEMLEFVGSIALDDNRFSTDVLEKINDKIEMFDYLLNNPENS